MTRKLTKVEKLAIAGAVAPTLRGEAPKRKIKVVDKEGKVVREIDDLELRKKVLEAQEIEFGTFPPDPRDQKVCAGPDGKSECPYKSRPKPIDIGPASIRSRQGKPWTCLACHKRRRIILAGVEKKMIAAKDQKWCAGGCGKSVPDRARTPKVVSQRGGGLWNCRSCASRAIHRERGSHPISVTCAGHLGPCPKQKNSSVRAMQPSRVAARHGEPWRCTSCSARRSQQLPDVRKKHADRARMAWRAGQFEGVKVGARRKMGAA